MPPAPLKVKFSEYRKAWRATHSARNPSSSPRCRPHFSPPPRPRPRHPAFLIWHQEHARVDNLQKLADHSVRQRPSSSSASRWHCAGPGRRTTTAAARRHATASTHIGKPLLVSWGYCRSSGSSLFCVVIINSQFPIPIPLNLSNFEWNTLFKTLVTSASKRSY